MKTLSFPDHYARMRYQFELFDDFDWLISPHRWTNLAADGGVTGFATGDTKYGVLQGATGATNNNEIAIRSTNALALFAADYAFVFEVRLQYTEANTDDANVAIGLADAAGADLLTDNGAGSGIANTGVLIYKVDSYSSGNFWRAIATNNATSKATDSVQTASGASFVVLRIEGKAVDQSNMQFRYFLDDLPLTDSNNRPINHQLAFASAVVMRLVPNYLKAGGANSETMNVDYVLFASTRV